MTLFHNYTLSSVITMTWSFVKLLQVFHPSHRNVQQWSSLIGTFTTLPPSPHLNVSIENETAKILLLSFFKSHKIQCFLKDCTTGVCIALRIAFLLLAQWPQIQFSTFPMYNVVKINRQYTAQRVDCAKLIVDLTHLELVRGKVVLQKIVELLVVFSWVDNLIICR